MDEFQRKIKWIENELTALKIATGSGGGGGGGVWGSIIGDINNQTDLAEALASKADADDVPSKVSELENDSGFITSSAVGNGRVTFTQGGETKGSFTTNQAGNTTINLDAGGGGGDHDELTQAEYDALTPEEQANGTVYFVKDGMNPQLSVFYPIGSIYMSVQPTNPSLLFGGVWEAISQGRALVGAGVVQANNDDWCGHTSQGDWTAHAGGMGGETFHTLTVGEMPSHNHPLNGGTDYVGIDGSGGNAYGLLQSGSNYRWKIGQMNVGGGQAHNNMPPYLVVYIWKRVS